MKSDIAVLGIAVVAAFAGLSASGLTTNEWQAVNGVWDGNWSAKDHWTLGAVPNAADQYVQFGSEDGKDYTVTVDGNYTVSSGELLAAGAKTRTTFAGTGKITGTDVVDSYAWVSRELVLDGVTLDFKGYINCCANLYVTNGASIVAGQLRSYDDTADIFVYDGCNVEASEFKTRTSMNFYVYEGATVHFNTVTRFSTKYTSRVCAFHVDGGDVTVDMFRLCSAGSGATLNAGSFTLGNIDASYGNNGTFDFQGGTATLGTIPSGLVLPSDTFKIGSQATVKIPVGTNYLLCKEGGLPATAKIVAVVPEGLAPAGYMVLRGWRDDTLPAALRESVTLEGAADGWAINSNASGHVVVWKRATVGAEGTSDYYEWTGAANDGVFSTPANWTDGTTTVPASAPNSTSIGVRLGASDKTDITTDGRSVKGFLFTAKAVDSYALTGSETVTPGNKTIFSYSAVPQHFGTTARSTGDIAFYADGAAPLFVGSSTLSRPMAFQKSGWYNTHVRGDIRIRTSDDSTSPFALNLLVPDANGVAPFTRVTAVSGNVIITNNVTTPTFAAAGAAFDVEAGATLVYKKFGDNGYQWTAEPSDFRINGTFDVQAAFVGGVNQTYGGSGVLKTAEIRPSATGNTVLNLQDTLVLEPSQDWVTANDAAPANTMCLGVAGGNPSIRLSKDWTYGPVEGTQIGTAERSLAIAIRSALTVDAGGHCATFKDYLTGKGTLIVTNGTVKLDYAAETRTNIRVCNTGVLEWTSANTLASLTVQPGGVLRPLAAVPLTFPSAQGAATATLTGSVLDIDRALLPTSGWLTVLRAEKGITGLPTLTDEGLVCRVRTVDGYAELQVKEKTGAILLFR